MPPELSFFFSPHLEKSYCYIVSSSVAVTPILNPSEMLLNSVIFSDGRPNTAPRIPGVDTPGIYKYTVFSVLFSSQWFLILYLIPVCLLIILYKADGFIELSVIDNTISLWQKGVKIKVNSESVILYLKLDSFQHFFCLH